MVEKPQGETYIEMIVAAILTAKTSDRSLEVPELVRRYQDILNALQASPPRR